MASDSFFATSTIGSSDDALTILLSAFELDVRRIILLFNDLFHVLIARTILFLSSKENESSILIDIVLFGERGGVFDDIRYAQEDRKRKKINVLTIS